MSVRKYWLRHPVQLRVTALLALLFVPVWLPIVAAIAYRAEILEVVVEQYRLLWNVLIKGSNA